MMEVSDVSDEGFLAYADLVKEQLAAEESRTASMEARAISVLTTSGGLVSLLLALAALVSTRKDFRMPVAGRAVLLVAVALFLLAALAAISVFSPGPRNLVDPAAMGDEIRRRWNDPVKVAQRKVLATRLGLLTSAQLTNDQKGGRLFLAAAGEALAVAVVAVAVGIVLVLG